MIKDVFHVTSALVFLMLSVLPGSSRSSELTIAGTGAGVLLLEAVADAFVKQVPGSTIVIPPSIGSGGGVKAVGSGNISLGRTARPLKEKEKHYGLEERLIARIPVVFYVNDTVRLTDVSYEAVCDIYRGTIRRWETIDGGSGKIRIIRREEGDSSLGILRNSLPGFDAVVITERSKTMFTDRATVEECVGTKNAIAFGTWPDVRSENGIHALALEGISPSSSDYPCMGELFLIFKPEAYRGILRDFVEFTASEEAVRVIRMAGGIPVE